MNSRRSSNADKKGGFKLLDIAHGTVPATAETEENSEEKDAKPNGESTQISTKNGEDNKTISESENFEETALKATKDDCLKLLKESFDGYDYNGNGTVAHEEVREAWMMCQEEWNQTCDPERCNLEASVNSFLWF